MKQLNPDVKINTYKERFQYQTAPRIAANYDLIVDCTDNSATRICINDICVKMNIPHIYAGIHRHEGQVAVFNFENSATYQCLFPEHQTTEVDCNDAGVIGMLPAVIGSIQAMETIKTILNLHSLLSNKLLNYNLLTHQQFIVKTYRKKNTTEVSLKRFENHTNFEKMTYKDIDLDELIDLSSNPNFTIIDVREAHEMPKLTVNYIHIPLRELPNKLDQLEKSKDIILVCQHGVRSVAGAQFLLNNGYINIYNLEGGMAEYA